MLRRRRLIPFWGVGRAGLTRSTSRVARRFGGVGDRGSMAGSSVTRSTSRNGHCFGAGEIVDASRDAVLREVLHASRFASAAGRLWTPRGGNFTGRTSRIAHRIGGGSRRALAGVRVARCTSRIAHPYDGGSSSPSRANQSRRASATTCEVLGGIAWTWDHERISSTCEARMETVSQPEVGMCGRGGGAGP